jgi:hypothetical protein
VRSKNTIFWDVTLYSLVEVCRHFEQGSKSRHLAAHLFVWPRYFSILKIKFLHNVRKLPVTTVRISNEISFVNAHHKLTNTKQTKIHVSTEQDDDVHPSAVGSWLGITVAWNLRTPRHLCIKLIQICVQVTVQCLQTQFKSVSGLAEGGELCQKYSTPPIENELNKRMQKQNIFLYTCIHGGTTVLKTVVM